MEQRIVPHALRRRSAAEQRVIRIIRGEDMNEDEHASVHVGQFKKLRALAARNALVVQEPGVPFLSNNELNLLAWLA